MEGKDGKMMEGYSVENFVAIRGGLSGRIKGGRCDRWIE